MCCLAGVILTIYILGQISEVELINFEVLIVVHIINIAPLCIDGNLCIAISVNYSLILLYSP